MTYYVYEHWRPDKNVCFYVGKGKGKRAWDMAHMRNCHHMAIVSKLSSLGLCVDVRIIAECLESKEALRIEIETIASYGVDNLSNMTRGGDGMSDPPEETRKRISEAQKKRFQRPEERKKASERNCGRVPWNKGMKTGGKKHSEETKIKLQKLAKMRGISDKTRKAQRAAVTGRKRAPFSAETIKRMSEAAKIREAKKRLMEAA